MNVKGHMICHTHWDREWYLTRESFRVKLITLIDNLLDIIEEDPEYVSFMLDGQTIVLEDYLEIRPDNRARLFKALESGKIICGPWYILPDELLISGEAHIQNYLTGQRMLREIAPPMNIGYLPDSFGHPAQLPQLLVGLGIESAVFWRGTSNEQHQSEFFWQGPDQESRILCLHMLCGYGNSANLDSDPEKVQERLDKMLERLGAINTTATVLLMNGSDHITGQSDIAEIIKRYNQKSTTHKIEFSTLESFVNEVKAKLPELETFHGELRSGERSMVLGGTLSTRMYLKQHNHLVQKQMERYWAPMLAFEVLQGTGYNPLPYSHYVWKKILENHPHDSICGCSTDEVHREMMTRFACLEDLQQTLSENSFKRLGAARTNLETKPEADAQLFLFEPTQDPLEQYMELEIDIDSVLVQEVNFSESIIEDYESQIAHPELPENIRITLEDGREVPTLFLGAQKAYFRKYQDHTMPEEYKVNRVKVAVLLPPITYGLHCLSVWKSPKASQKGSFQGGNFIENAFYHVAYDQEGFVVTHKASGQTWQGVGRLIDSGDAGDEYTYSWPEEDQIFVFRPEKIDARGNGFQQELVVRGEFNLPKSLTADRQRRSQELVACPVTISLSLTAGVERLDFTVDFDNQAQDHRLSVEFPAGILSQMTRSFNTFAVTERPISQRVPPVWMEYPQDTHPTHGFANISEQGKGVSLYSQGLTEYEGQNRAGQSYLKLTLLRAVGWLSRTDLLSRKGNGGWSVFTPEAQCLGKHQFDFSVLYHDQGWEKGYGILEKRVHPVSVYQSREENSVLLGDMALSSLSKLPEGIRLSTLKAAEDGRGIVLRLFSLVQTPTEITLTLPSQIQKAFKADLKEDAKETLPIIERTITCMIQPAEIVTLRLE